jgi:uncharacterized Tic20 family protein
MNYYQLQQQQNSGLLHTEDERQWGLFLHLSSLANLIVPFSGYIIPIAIWQSKKDEMPAIVAHGKEAANWMISSFIYSLLSIFLIVIGFLITIVLEMPILGIFIIGLTFIFFFGLSIVSIVYAIMGGIKANNGEHWKYPLNIRFLK